MNICIIGTGYVGLVTGTCFAEMGNDVICVDSDIQKINNLNKTIIPIFEPGLEELVKLNISKERLRFTTDIDNAVKQSKVCFIAVGTPQDEDGSADLKCVLSVAKSIAKAMNEYKVIVDKSTVPVGTSKKVAQIIRENTKYDFDIVSNPEFLKQGSALDDFMNPDRIIIGANSENASKIMQEIYSPFLKTDNRIILMDIESAEMTKYAANSFLATKISFMNELANLCEKVGADIENVRIGISADTRIGNKFLFAGIGYGGSCFPKDVKALIKTGEQYGCDMSIIKATDRRNKIQRESFCSKIFKKFGSDLSKISLAVWGLSFKPKTDDMREAPSIDIINTLCDAGAKIKCYDPKAINNAYKIFKDKIQYCQSSYEALIGCDALLLLTEWNEFQKPDFNKTINLLNRPIIFDGRNQYNKDTMKEYGFEYYQVGR